MRAQAAAGSDQSRTRGAAGHVDSYYARHARRLKYHPPLEEDASCEVCVIGGGLAGLATALRLAEAGRDVLLVEARRLGWAASGRNGGFVSPGFAESIFVIERKLGLEHARELYRASVEGVGAIRRLIRESGNEDIIGGHGWLKMIRHGRTDELERRAERMARDYNANLEYLGVAQLSEYVSTKSYKAGLMDMAPFHIQPLEFAGLVAGEAVRSGARIFENSRAIDVKRKLPGWHVAGRDFNVTADHVVLATSVYGGPSQRLNSAMLPIATYVVTAERPTGDFSDAIRFDGCLGDTRRASDYYRLVGGPDSRKLLWGGRITTRRSQPARLAGNLLADIGKVYPQLDDLKVDMAWSGQMGYAVHKMPIIGRIDENLWAASAFGGHGLNTSMMAGGLVADAICDWDDRMRLFEPFGAVWAGGATGRLANSERYWRLRLLDHMGESLAGWFG